MRSTDRLFNDVRIARDGRSFSYATSAERGEVVRLFDEGYSIDQTAQILGWSPFSVAALLVDGIWERCPRQTPRGARWSAAALERRVANG